MAERRFKRGSAHRRSLHRVLSGKGWLLLLVFVIVIITALLVFGGSGVLGY